MMKHILRPLVISWLLVLTSSIAGCGSAEAIKGYRYHTTKDNLEKAVRKVIKTNPNIYRDSTQDNKLDSMMEKAQWEHSIVDSTLYNNDGNYRVTIKIKVGQVENDYVFTYYGDEETWKSSLSSEIFISEARDKYGNGLRQGHNETGQFKTKRAKEFIELFETEFIDKIDKELILKHTDL